MFLSTDVKLKNTLKRSKAIAIYILTLITTNALELISLAILIDQWGSTILRKCANQLIEPPSFNSLCTQEKTMFNTTSWSYTVFFGQISAVSAC